jgi:hypothetical protein
MMQPEVQSQTDAELQLLLPAAARALAAELRRDPGELKVVSFSHRSYSRVWEIQSASGSFILKWLPRRAERELELARLCRTAFAGVEFVRTPAIVCCPTPDTLLVEKLPGRALQAICTTPSLWQLRRWVEVRCRLLHRVGTWLRTFHGTSLIAAPAPLDGVRAYVLQRSAALAALPQEMTDEFWRVLNSTSAPVSARVHGDFTPHNILVDGHTIAVIDLAGISEFEVETPSFDAAAMVVGLEEAWRYRMRNPLRFGRGTVDAMIGAFLDASGVSGDRTFPVCYAVRHLTRIYNILRKSGRAPGPRNWHVQRVRLALEKPEAIRVLGGARNP